MIHSLKRPSLAIAVGFAILALEIFTTTFLNSVLLWLAKVLPTADPRFEQSVLLIQSAFAPFFFLSALVATAFILAIVDDRVRQDARFKTVDHGQA